MKSPSKAPESRLEAFESLRFKSKGAARDELVLALNEFVHDHCSRLNFIMDLVDFCWPRREWSGLPCAAINKLCIWPDALK